MTYLRAAFTGLLVVATAGTAVLTSGPAAAAPVRPVTTPAATITLVTGDVVTLGGPRGVDVVAARGREHIGFHAQKDVDGDIHVIPDDALALVSSGKLDPRLFDVTELAKAGYGDADRKDLPLIVDYPGATPKAAGAQAVRELPSVSAVAMRAEKSPAFWATARGSATKIWLDGPVKASLAQSVPQIGAPEAWAGGHTGAGTTVAVLDTGIDATHPDLDDAVTGAQDFSGSESGIDDRNGHGTHVASIITGDGEVNKGVAPDAKLLNAKVLQDNGYGQESWIIAGMEWAAASGADVINMSLGSRQWSDGTDPMSQAVNRITAETGALFVIAAGNTGPYAETISSPGAADAALTVGAVDREDKLAEFSSRGPRWLDGAIKPDITAPGVDIVAAKAVNGVIGTPAGDGYVSLSGTSMAAPHVAGAAAILAGQHKDWQAEQLKSTLMNSAKPNPDLSVFEQGAGRVDVAAATEATVSASPGSLSLGTVQWPHTDDEPITKTVTYTNHGTEPAILDLAATMTGPDGNAAPAGMFTMSPAQLTVPAGGTAAATLTTDMKVEGTDGVYSGAVVANAGDTEVRTATAVTREVESYDVKLTFFDHNGKPTPQYYFRFVEITRQKAHSTYDESGTVTARVPKGKFFFDGWIGTQGDGDYGLTTRLNEPAFVVDGPAEYTFDARDGKELGFVLDKPEARPSDAMVGFLMTTVWGETGSIYLSSNFDNFWALPSRTRAPGDFTLLTQASLAKPDGTGQWPGFHASPYLYNVSHTDESGGVPADLVRRVTDAQLAKVVTEHAATAPNKIGIRAGSVTMPLPYTMIEYYTPGTDWYESFVEASSWGEWPQSGFVNRTTKPRSFELGRTYRERWNVGVFGPGFAPWEIDPGTEFARRGDELLVDVGMYSDQNPNHDGFSWTAEGSTQLLRDGEVIAESSRPGDIFTNLPPEAATYTVRTTSTQPGPLSTRVDAEWTFRSSHTEGETPTPVPALTVRFAPNLDNHNAAPAGKKFRIPVYVQRNGSPEGAGRTNIPTVEISYDDGRTWQPTRLTRHGGQWQAEVNHPKNAQFASLRWTVSDQEGNTAKATIIHAYVLRK